ncbi:hypothetical protein O181_102227 [Austropuccinia psidii MF-1]|uniref:Uncharacterized protein n=1 Tax=Austropuccinia psidii MF-1 TaxID=1389203 RepID=A0A9Q3JHG0_9BASI|nr:hypothetical protein [Austropuccinia psidii MF-1]
MGQPKLTLYSLLIQPPDPFFKHYHPAIRPHTRNAHLLSDPSDHVARAREDSFVVENDESIPEREGMPGPQTGRQE